MYVVLFATTLLAVTNGFFEYSDCSDECIGKSLPCTITETESGSFPIKCEKSELNCELDSSRQQVCLRKGKRPVGGEDIWQDFKRNHRTTTVAPTPTTARPHIDMKCNILN